MAARCARHSQPSWTRRTSSTPASELGAEEAGLDEHRPNPNGAIQGQGFDPALHPNFEAAYGVKKSLLDYAGGRGDRDDQAGVRGPMTGRV